MTPQNKKYATTALCARIQAAAINCDTMHVFVDYAPHVTGLFVKVHPLGYSYSPCERRENIFDATVWLENDDAIDKLTAIIDQLQRMGVVV